METLVKSCRRARKVAIYGMQGFGYSGNHFQGEMPCFSSEVPKIFLDFGPIRRLSEDDRLCEF